MSNHILLFYVEVIIYTCASLAVGLVEYYHNDNTSTYIRLLKGKIGSHYRHWTSSVSSIMGMFKKIYHVIIVMVELHSSDRKV